MRLAGGLGLFSEARRTAKMEHPGIVPAFDVDCHEGMYFIVSKLIDGIDLGRRMSSSLPELAEAMLILAEAADALDHAHQCGILHLDVKPSNILLDQSGLALLTDFGIACTMTGMGPSSGCGTPAYQAPEQKLGDPAVIDARADIYGLGVVLFELLTGTLPEHNMDGAVPVPLTRQDGRVLPELLAPILPPSTSERTTLPTAKRCPLFVGTSKSVIGHSQIVEVLRRMDEPSPPTSIPQRSKQFRTRIHLSRHRIDTRLDAQR